MLPFHIKLEKPNFGPIWVFFPPIPKQQFRQNMFNSIFDLKIYQKLIKLFDMKKPKKHIFGYFLPKHPSAIFFPKKSFESTLYLYAAATSSKKLEKFHAFTFHKT